MIHIHPNQGEKFYLRLLLKNRSGSRSFEDLRTIDGELYPTYKAACIAMELLENDMHWDETLGEAASHSSPASFRLLYCSILLHGEPALPQQLYEKYEDEMMSDFIHRLNHVPNLSDEEKTARAKNLLLCFIDETLFEENKSNRDFDIPESDYNGLNDMRNQLEENDDNARTFYEDHVSLLNLSQ